MEKKRKELSINYRDLEVWIACANCNSPKAKVEKGSLQLYYPNCRERQNLVESDQ